MLRVSLSPVRVDLRVPLGVQSELEIRANRPANGEAADVTVAESPQAVAIFWKNAPILMAQQIDDDSILLHTDFRPLGIEIFDDAAGLHIGGSILGGNSFAGCSTAIALG
jgi:hypothetical protein